MRVGQRSKRGVKDERKTIVFIDESGFMLQPNMIATFAPSGQTPVIKCWERHDRISVIGAITLSPSRKRYGFYFSVEDENITNIHLVKFLKNIRRALNRDILVIFDNLKAHHTAAKILSRRPFRENSYTFEFLPSYAPELNPVEFIWGNTKNHKMANFIPDDIFDLDEQLNKSLFSVTKGLVMGAMKYAGLEI